MVGDNDNVCNDDDNQPVFLFLFLLCGFQCLMLCYVYDDDE